MCGCVCVRIESERRRNDEAGGRAGGRSTAVTLSGTTLAYAIRERAHIAVETASAAVCKHATAIYDLRARDLSMPMTISQIHR